MKFQFDDKCERKLKERHIEFLINWNKTEIKVGRIKVISPFPLKNHMSWYQKIISFFHLHQVLLQWTWNWKIPNFIAESVIGGLLVMLQQK